MKSFEDMLKESVSGTKHHQELFAEQFNKVSNMLDKDYGIRSVHLVLIVRDILDRVYAGEKIVSIDIQKMYHYNTHNVIPENDRLCYIIPLGCKKERLTRYCVLGDLFYEKNGREHSRSSIEAWRYPEREEI